MPSQYDNTYHNEFSKPVYDTPEEKIKFQTIREADYVLETRAPREPTREEELQYLDWLEGEFKSDPWITHRFRKYTAGPKRWPWKNQREQKNAYQTTFMLNFGIGFLLTWPLGVYMGRRAQRQDSGIPAVPMNKFKHDFINLDATSYARKMFRSRFIMTCTAGGVFFAYMTTRGHLIHDEWYSRPDLKPFPAMVPQEQLTDSERIIFQTYYQRYRDEKNAENRKNKTWYRILFPLTAEFDTDRNPYHGTHKENVYNPYNTYHGTPNNVHFRHHMNE